MDQSSDRKETKIVRLCAFLRLHTFLPITCRQISRHERRSEEIVKLWENPQWQVRKQVVHDFSQAVSGDYMQKTTLDVDLQEILSSVNIKIGDRIAIPIEWRPKGLVMSLNASFDENTSHVISRAICQRAALIILESGALATLNSTNEANSHKSILGGLPQCIENILETLIKMPPREILKRELDAISILPHLRSLTPSHDKTRGCAQECVGDLHWKTLQEDSLFMSILAAFTLGYVRAVEVPVTSNGIAILKTKEVVASNPFEQVRSSVPDALWLQADPANLTIRRTINVDIPADANMIKCLPPNYAHFAPTPSDETILFNSPTPPADQTDPIRLKVQEDGAWAYHKQGIQDDGCVRGSRIEIRKGMVDVVARRANLIFPGLILASLGLLSQAYMLIHILISPDITGKEVDTESRAGIEAPLIGGIAIIVPLIVLAYASTSRHVLLSRLLEPYRLILIWGTLVQLVAIGLAALFEQVSIGLLNFGLMTSGIILAVFLDATKQKYNNYYVRRLNCLRNFRQKIGQLVIWGSISALAPIATALGQICLDVSLWYAVAIAMVRLGLIALSWRRIRKHFSIESRRLNINWLIALSVPEAVCLTLAIPTSIIASHCWGITICLIVLLIVLQIAYLAARIFSIYILSYTVHGKNCSKCRDPEISCTTKTGSQLIKIPDKGKDDYKAFGIIDVKDLFTDDVSADKTPSQSAVEGGCE